MNTDAGQKPHAQRSAGTVAQAANDPAVLALEWLLGAARGLNYLLGRALERDIGITLVMLDVLLLLGREGSPLPMRRIAQALVLTTGGASRLVDRMQAAGLVRREICPHDERVRLVALTESGAATTVRAAHQHADNIQRYMLDALPHERRETLLAALTGLSHQVHTLLPQMP